MKTEYLLMRELGHVLAALTPTNRLVCEVCLQTGLRIGDVMTLRAAELKPRFWITEAKTGKRHMVALTNSLYERVWRQSGETWVFPGRTDPKRHRARQSVYADVKRAAKAFRLPQNVGVHSMRKVYAVELFRKYGDIERVKRALNHGSVNTTMIYAMADMLLERRLARCAVSKLRIDKPSARV